jgi:Zn-finger nucleic acid-binding protein
MKCLNCLTEMTNYDVVTKNDRLSYDTCEQCGSLWLDAGELDKMAFHVKGSIEYCADGDAIEPETRARKCPRCDDSTLQKVRFLGCDDISLHHCPNCEGFWLDGGELKLIDDELAKIMPVSGHGFSDFVNNVHVPYWYKRVKRKSSETDFDVEVLPIKGAVLKASTPDRCPSCDSNLNLYRVFGMDFEGCPTCKGLWLTKEELRELKNKTDEGSLRWLNDEINNIEKASVVASNRSCVRCKTVKMVSIIFGTSSVLVDWCPQCHGMWLDRGEFDAIAAYLKDELMRMGTRDIEAHAMADVAHVVKGGPESRLAELLDAKAAVSALVNATIFEHPLLFSLLANPPVR